MDSAWWFIFGLVALVSFFGVIITIKKHKIAFSILFSVIFIALSVWLLIVFIKNPAFKLF